MLIICSCHFLQEEIQKQTDTAMDYLKTQMGKDVNKIMRAKTEINLNKEEIKEYVKRFNALDHDKKGFVVINDIRNSLEVSITLLPLSIKMYFSSLVVD